MARLGLAVALILIVAAPALAGDTGAAGRFSFASREFGDWSVACDNAKECRAVSVSRAYVTRIESADPGDYASPKLWVQRAADPEARPRIFVDSSVWGEVRPLGPLSLHVYYDCDGDCTGRAYRISELEPGRYELAPRQVEQFMAESAKSDRAATRRGDGTMHGILTTSGLMAAMLHMDEVQQRTGTETAISIHARGDKPASAVPPAPVRAVVKVVGGEEEPVTEAFDHRELNLKRAEHCENVGSTSADPVPQRFKLANGQKLWSVGCSSNPHFEKRLWLIETGENHFELFRLPRPDQGRPAEVPILPNSDFDTATGRITSFAGKACGWRRSWAWNGWAFKLVEAIEMPACIDILPGRWLQTYRAVPNLRAGH